MSRLNKSLLGLVAISATTTAAAVESPIGGCIQLSNGATACRTPVRLSSQQQQHQNRTIMTNAGVTERSTAGRDGTEAAKAVVQQSQIVCFDVDSTVIVEEGIDELARYCGKGAEVAKLTKEAMTGSMSFQEALRRRLDIIRPTQQQIREFVKTHPSTLSTGVRDFVAHLRATNKRVYLISGGFDCLIWPVAVALDIPLANVFANKLFFTYNGEYAGFDTTQPTSRSGGKGDAIHTIKAQYGTTTTTTTTTSAVVVTMIGDGMTDREAAPPADHFIGYGGNVVREEVRNRAAHFVTSFEQLYNKS